MRSTAVLLATLLLAASATADDSASVAVSARVIARVVVDVASQPAEVVVTDADLARGYVEVSEPLAVRVRTNSRDGYLLQVANSSDVFPAIELAFGNTSMTVAGESWVARPYVPAGELVTAQIRVRLAPGAEVGRYPLPIQVSASPL
ncbi:MAG TPA: hypothetical protein VM779_05900 [Thermoanaerobaculia bacterium]|nr:hypothetical protein [Thermoanaerobaculia bacterium]